MDIYEFANMLNGRYEGEEIEYTEECRAKNLGYVVVFGYSDDNIEFRGAINDEFERYGGGEVYLDKDGDDIMHELLGALRQAAFAIWINLPEGECPVNRNFYDSDCRIVDFGKLHTSYENAVNYLGKFLNPEFITNFEEIKMYANLYTSIEKTSNNCLDKIK
jgi:hypothetical protein